MGLHGTTGSGLAKQRPLQSWQAGATPWDKPLESGVSYLGLTKESFSSAKSSSKALSTPSRPD